MAPPGNHNKIIDQSARSILKPIGCTQKGKSRLWFDDQRWWVGVIEFQPSSWNKGSYLNVGAMWLWNAKEHWSFDDGYRVDTFHAYKNDDQFSRAAVALAERAAQEVLRMRQAFSSIDLVSRHLSSKEKMSIWDRFHSAIAASLAGDVERARLDFSAVAGEPAHAPWVAELQAKALLFSRIGSSVEAIRLAVAEEVTKARSLLKLPPCLDAADLWGRQSAHRDR
jgi:hypothetical protein